MLKLYLAFAFAVRSALSWTPQKLRRQRYEDDPYVVLVGHRDPQTGRIHHVPRAR